jgi:3-oxoacyl-[acyl-carrier protein] reductase
VALVTGAATGIGKAIAHALAATGSRVVVNHPHTPAAAAETVASIRAEGGDAVAMAADVSVRAEYDAMVDRMLTELGHWDSFRAGCNERLWPAGPTRRDRLHSCVPD